METYFGEIEQAYERLAREQALLDLRTLISDTEALVNATAQDVRVETREVRARLAATIERAKATCLQLQKQDAEAARAAIKRTDTIIHRYPYHFIGGALGVGLLLGALAALRNPWTCASSGRE